ncbi:DUF308 domain-containing protein, partial [Escherichia coli]
LAVLARGGPGAILGGIVLILAGIGAMAFTPLTASVLVTLLGGLLLVIGVAWVGIGVRLAGGNPLVLAPGVILLIAGIVALVWPEIALSIIAVVSGL